MISGNYAGPITRYSSRFTFAGHYGCHEMGKVMWDPENPEKLKMSTSGPDPSPIYHFFSKLLWLKDLMLTETGRMEAEKRHQFLVEFWKDIKRSVSFLDANIRKTIEWLTN